MQQQPKPQQMQQQPKPQQMQQQPKPQQMQQQPNSRCSSSHSQCGPGTVLKNGACVLDERCGPGTVLKNGACVLDSTSSSSGGKGMGKESIMGFVIAFLGAGIVAVVFGIIARSQKK